MNIQIEASWNRMLSEEFAKPYFAALREFVTTAYETETVYPPKELIFRAFDSTPFDRVKVVIFGQDPYHEPGQAQGLAFYVPPGIRTPPSLVNIGKEVGHHPNLLSWAEQGVLLLNATLTVAQSKPGSHQNHGWETFTDAVAERLNARREHLVFMLWGAYAQHKGAFIDRARHCVLESPHPSPLSARRGFFGCGHFTKCNDYLVRNGQSPIAW